MIVALAAALLLAVLISVSIGWAPTAAFLGSALAGMVGGSILTRRVSAASLRRGFAWVVILLGAAILGFQTLATAGLR
jgi:hypothetical protein